MNADELEQAIDDAGLSWDPLGTLVQSSAPHAGCKNSTHCKSLTKIANHAGLTAEQLMPSLLALAGDLIADPPIAPDNSGLKVHAAAARSMKSAMAARGIGWSVEAGEIVVWHIDTPGSISTTSEPFAGLADESVTLKIDGSPTPQPVVFTSAAVDAESVCAEVLASIDGLDVTADAAVHAASKRCGRRSNVRVDAISQGASAILGLTVGDNFGMSLRASTEVVTVVTTQDFYAQADIAGASLEDMAQALLELVGNPAADPPVAPDSAAFDAIMSAS